MATRDLVLSLAHTHAALRVENYHLYPPTTLSIPNMWLMRLQLLVSSDTAITIAFGVLGTAINLFGILIAYLTLRAMIVENRTYRPSLQPTLYLL